MLSVRKLHDVAGNWVFMFELLVGGNLHIFEILVFQIGFPGGYTALPQDFIQKNLRWILYLCPSAMK